MNDGSRVVVRSPELAAKEHGSPEGKHREGFTLLEVLIAMSIMSVIVTVIYTSFSTAGRNVEQAEAIRDANDLVVTLMAKLSDEITNAYVNPGMSVPTVFYGKKVEPETGDEKNRYDELYLTTLTDPISRSPDSMDMWEVGYFFKQKPDGSGFVLMRREKRELTGDVPALEGGDEYAVTDRVASLQFRYSNGSTWSDEWNNRSALPKAVEISIALSSGPTYTTVVEVQR